MTEGRWYKAKEGSGYVIRRMVDDGVKRRQIRYPAHKYAAFKDDVEAIDALVTRLNYRADAEDRARKAFNDQIAFVKNATLDEFRSYLDEQIPSKVYASGVYGHVKTHFLGYFQNILGLKDPLEWHKCHKEKWSRYLNDPELDLAPKTKRAVVQAANRFMTWLHERSPDVPKLVFEPITRAKYRTLGAEYAAREDVQRAKLVSDKHWDKIKAVLPDHLAPFVMLAYHYGLRRAETLALRPSDVRNAHLAVERQLFAIKKDKDGKILESKTKLLKGKENRKVPHWFCTPAKALRWIEQAQALAVHPDTLGKEWAALMESVGLSYTLHDFRHTWITRSIRKHLPRDVQLAAGHKSIETTMGYLHDDRDLDDEEYRPTG